MDTEKKVSRGLHGLSLGSIIAALTVLLASPHKTESVLWYLNHRDSVQEQVTKVPQLNSLVFDLRLRMDRMEARHKHNADSLKALIKDMQRATHVLAEGKEPYDSVSVVLSSGQRKSFHVNTSWIWRKRE